MSLRSQNGKPLSNICTAERDGIGGRDGERRVGRGGQCHRCVYRYLGVVGTKGVVVWG